MIDWFSQHGVEFAAFVLTLVVTIVGWVLEHRSSKEQNKEREDDIRLLREQLDSLQRQATTLEEQTAMQRADHDKPPFSDAESGSGLDPARPHRGITQRACGVGYTTGGCNNVPIEDAIT